MLALILNPNDELKLIEYAEKLAASLYESDFSEDDGSFYTVYPLWTVIDKSRDYSQEELKDFSKSILGIRLGLLLFDGSSIFLPVQLDIKSQESKTELECRLELLKLYGKKNTAQELPADIQKNAAENFPMQLKVFRIANAVNLSRNSRVLSAFVWKKL